MIRAIKTHFHWFVAFVSAMWLVIHAFTHAVLATLGVPCP